MYQIWHSSLQWDDEDVDLSLCCAQPNTENAHVSMVKPGGDPSRLFVHVCKVRLWLLWVRIQKVTKNACTTFPIFLRRERSLWSFGGAMQSSRWWGGTWSCRACVPRCTACSLSSWPWHWFLLAAFVWVSWWLHDHFMVTRDQLPVEKEPREKRPRHIYN